MDLDSALQQRRLTVIAGAGISMLHPSCLPGWWAFNMLFIEAIKNKAISGFPELASNINRLKLDDIPVQSFSDNIVNLFAGESYFPVLNVLDCPQTNSNHLSLAVLAAERGLHSIVTTNFDTLIERAFREQGVELNVFNTREDFRIPNFNDHCSLYKIHGSVKESTSLIDTVSQKSRGLPDYTRDALTDLFKGKHLLFIGFSGADLEFDLDYLPLSGALKSGASVTWIIRPGSRARIPPNVLTLLP